MPLIRSEQGVWTLQHEEADAAAIRQSHESYVEALPRYLTALDPAFERARATSEFNFMMTILAIRGAEDAGWDPYESSVRAISSIRQVLTDIEGNAAEHLALWLYGHIMEASEPYEFVANLIDVSAGGQFNVRRFPDGRSGSPLSPQTKIERLAEQANTAGLPSVVIPMQEAWNRQFRNAIFHADYSLYGGEVRTMRPLQRYDHDQVLVLVNRALAYHEALTILRRTHVESYKEPTRIPADPRFTNLPNEEAIVIVRQGYGATGLKDGYTLEQLRRGFIHYRMGRFSAEEIRLLESDRLLASLPART